MNNIDLANFTSAQGFMISGSEADDHAGLSVSNVGDVNGDGINDLIVGAEQASPRGRTYAGAAYVIYGQNSSMANIDLANLTLAQGFMISGSVAFDLAGSSVSNVGDINADGINDIIIGAYYASPRGRSHAGVAYVIYGKNSSMANIDLANFTLTQGFMVSGGAANNYAGCSVSSAGDVNADGINDIIVGAYIVSPNGRTRAGAAYVIYGKNSSMPNIDLAKLTLAQGFMITGGAAGDWAGYSASDVNADGVNDIIVGAYSASPNGRTRAGAAYVIYGKNSSMPNIDLAHFSLAQGFMISGSTAGDCAGIAVSSAGDINADGANDLIVGAFFASPSGRYEAGVAYVIYGKNSNMGNIDLAKFTLKQGFMITGSASARDSNAGDRAGNSVSGVGDINADGVDDFIIGAYFASPNGRSRAGAAYVIYGNKNNPTPAPITIEPTGTATSEPVTSSHTFIVLDHPASIGIALSNAKIDLVSFNASKVSFDYHDDGNKTKTSWVGLLCYA